MTYKAVNCSNQPIILTLYHERYCAAGGPCGCVREMYDGVAYDARTGNVGLSRGVRVRPVSHRIEPRASVNGLERQIFRVPGVAEMIKSGALSIIEVPATNGLLVASKVEGSSRRTSRRLSAEPKGEG